MPDYINGTLSIRGDDSNIITKFECDYGNIASIIEPTEKFLARIETMEQAIDMQGTRIMILERDLEKQSNIIERLSQDLVAAEGEITWLQENME